LIIGTPDCVPNTQLLVKYLLENLWKLRLFFWFFRQIIKRTLERLNLPAALINVPLNISRISPYKLNQPPWMVW
jgi:hypothetical protein